MRFPCVRARIICTIHPLHLVELQLFLFHVCVCVFPMYMYSRSVASSVHFSCFISEECGFSVHFSCFLSEKCASSVHCPCSHFTWKSTGRLFLFPIYALPYKHTHPLFLFYAVSVFMQLLHLFVKQGYMRFAHLSDNILLQWYPRTLVLQLQQSKDWCQLSTATIYTFTHLYIKTNCVPIWWIQDQSPLLKVEWSADLSTKLSLVKKVYFWVLLNMIPQCQLTLDFQI